MYDLYSDYSGLYMSCIVYRLSYTAVPCSMVLYDLSTARIPTVDDYCNGIKLSEISRIQLYSVLKQ